MSKRLKLSDLAKIMAQKAATSASKGVVISEGSETTSGKRALDDGSKGKQVAQPLESKKAKINTGASEAHARPPIASGEGSSVRRTLGEALGPQASVMASAATAEKILAGVILPADKEKVDKLTFDQVVTKFLHVLGQGVILGSSLAVRSRDFAESALNQKAIAESAEMEMDADARDKVIARLEARISELERSQSVTQGRIIAAFKESDDFLEAAVRGSASSYFGDGFDFCKRQLAHQYPDLGIDLEDVEMDHELLAKEEAEAEKKAAEEGAAGVEGGWRSCCLRTPSYVLILPQPLTRFGWYYFKARPEKNLLRGSPSNVKGWKTRFFFASGDEWEFPSGTADSDSIPRVPISWGTPGKSCNKLPTLSEVDAKRTKTVFGKIEPGGYFEVSKVLGSRTFRKHFAAGCAALSTSGRDNTTSGDDGEFVTREDSVEYLGVIRRGIGGAIRRALPGIPDETLLRWLGGKLYRLELVPPPWVKKQGRPRNRNRRAGLLEGKGSRAAPCRLKDSNPTEGRLMLGARAAEAGTSSPGGISESMMSDAAAAWRLLIGVIPASDKKEVDQLSENDLVAKSFHALGQEHLHDIDFHMACADSAELELVKAQKRAVKAENQLAELSEEGSKPGTEVDDLKATVAELTNKLEKAKELAIEDFKASGEFKAAVTDSAATYFSEGFEFYKR
ncbi:hypothetical protein Acr_25g0002580 [Actinidia rufa]|uniref:Uncharacterized protein n=1 Tax=Actinidia rufa TaxID=165716 RepID=A0A7J0GYE5_9ERIC|nr:hypothetical protein Acr_25g0002580 [Actinidia rufa]